MKKYNRGANYGFAFQEKLLESIRICEKNRFGNERHVFKNAAKAGPTKIIISRRLLTESSMSVMSVVQKRKENPSR